MVGCFHELAQGFPRVAPTLHIAGGSTPCGVTRAEVLAKVAQLLRKLWAAVLPWPRWANQILRTFVLSDVQGTRSLPLTAMDVILKPPWTASALRTAYCNVSFRPARARSDQCVPKQEQRETMRNCDIRRRGVLSSYYNN